MPYVKGYIKKEIPEDENEDDCLLGEDDDEEVKGELEKIDREVNSEEEEVFEDNEEEP